MANTVGTGRRGIELDLHSTIAGRARLHLGGIAHDNVSGNPALLAAQVQTRLLGVGKIEAVAGDTTPPW
jgi:hypothetical protein